MKNKHRYTPIQFLALHMAMFNAKKTTKQQLAHARATLAETLYRASQPRRNQRL